MITWKKEGQDPHDIVCVCKHMKECVHEVYANNMIGLRARLTLEVKDHVLFTVTSLIINTVPST